MITCRPVPFSSSLGEQLAAGPGQGISLYWLGQAGFVIDAYGRRYVIDPYLSNTLADKYRNTAFSHERMMPAPLKPEALGAIDLVLCTHDHTDHMDGETLRRLAIHLPKLKFVVPAASRELARERIGVEENRLIEVDAGDRIEIEALDLSVVRAAHETIEKDEKGHHRFLGYGLGFSGLRILHSGDTIPFVGQDEEITAFSPDIALLPVNGRSDSLRSAGFAGNSTLAEAVALCNRVGIPTMIAHHYGMFAFNTADPLAIDRTAEHVPIELLRACCGVEFRLDVD